MGKRTPLYECHVKAKAKIVDFHGWDMPVNYGSQIDEHHAVRKASGVFDVSHMTVVDVVGVDAKKYLLHLIPNNVDKLKQIGKALYTTMLNEKGGIVDDLIVYYFADNDFRLIVNSATREKDLAWLQKQTAGYQVKVNPLPDYGMLAIQGPKARMLAETILVKEVAEKARLLERFMGVRIGNIFVSRTGYTGEDGYEIVMPSKDAIILWDKVLAAGVKPCGLGARDTLRLEAGLNLYGDDMDDTVTPLESNVGWTVGWEPKERDFIGRAILEKQRQEGVRRVLTGLALLSRGVPRNHDKVFLDGREIGVVTSGSFSPTLERGIALVRIQTPISADKVYEIESRGRRLEAKIVKPPFVRDSKATFVL